MLLDTPNNAWSPLFSEFVADLRTHPSRARPHAVVYGNETGNDPQVGVRQWAELRPTAVLLGLGLSICAQGIDLLKRSRTQAVITWGGQQAPSAHLLRTDMIAPGAADTSA